MSWPTFLEGFQTHMMTEKENIKKPSESRKSALREAITLATTGFLFLTIGAYLFYFGGYVLGGWWNPPAFMFVWAGVSITLVSLAYGLELATASGAGLLRKSSTGHVPLLVSGILFPYTCSRFLKILLYRRITGEAPWTALGPHIYIGGRLFPREINQLRRQGVVAVLDVAAEVPRDWGMGNKGLDYEAMPVMDLSVPPVDQLLRGVDWATNHLNLDHKVLIQCTMGHGRSALFAAAVMIATGRASGVPDATAIIQSRRKQARLKRGAARFLEQVFVNYSKAPRSASSLTDDSSS